MKSKRDASELIELLKKGVHSQQEMEWHKMMLSQERGDGRLPGLSLLLKFNEAGMQWNFTQAIGCANVAFFLS